jgi:8-oxo-dGTP pyrophosphatase MutT (NUDIX family)
MRALREKVGTSLVLVPSVTAIVFNDDGRVLLVRAANGGLWAAPGGAIDPDETPQDAVVREVWEETGLHVEPVGVCGAFGGPEFRVRYDNGDEVSYVMGVFECRLLGGRLRPDGEEILEARYFAADELAHLDLAAWARLVLPALIVRRGKPWIPAVTWQPPKTEE